MERERQGAQSAAPHTMLGCAAQYGQPDEWPRPMVLAMASGVMENVCPHSPHNQSQEAECFAIRQSCSLRVSWGVAP